MDLSVLRSELVRDEGLRLEAYKDVCGFLTIGVGRNLDSNPLSASEVSVIGHDCRKLPITREQAGILLVNDILTASTALDKYLPWWKNLDEVRRRVLINMAFNLGISGLMGFKQTLSSIRSGDYVAAAGHMLQSTWANQVPDRADRLASMMRTGAA